MIFIVLFKVVLTFFSVCKVPKCDQMKAIEQYFPVVLFVMLYKVCNSKVFIILKCDHSNEGYRTVLYCGAVYYAVQGGSNF